MSSTIERDESLATASKVAAVANEFGIFVLTGSYSIDALTGGVATHGDIDGNLFINTLDRDTAAIVGGAMEGKLPVIARKATGYDRLEYVIESDTTSPLVELQLMNYADDHNDELTLPGINGAGERILVPLTKVIVADSLGTTYEFRVKSLSYAIATWALRISGLVDHQKRAVRQTDIAHFALLLSQPHDEAVVHRAIMHHPQMTAVSPSSVLQRAAYITGLTTWLRHS